MVLSFYSQSYASDLLEKVIQPSKEYEQIVDLGNNKQAVGNEIFREGTSVDTKANLWCYKNRAGDGDPISCQANGWFWNLGTQKCYEKAEIKVQGNKVEEKKSNCETVAGGEWIFATGVAVSQKQPLIVRITTRLLRITVVLSVTMLIYIGIKLILAGMSWGNFGEGLKDLRNVIIGLILALSSVAIIWLVQSFTLNSLTGNTIDLQEITQPQ